MATAVLESKPSPTSDEIRQGIRALKVKRDTLRQQIMGAPPKREAPREDEPLIKKLLGKFYRSEPVSPVADPKKNRVQLESELDTVEVSIDRLRSTFLQTKEEERVASIAALTPKYREELKHLLEAVTRAVQANDRLTDLEYAMDHQFAYSLSRQTIHGLSLRTSATLKEWMERVNQFLGQKV